ncbi:uncharacterized protein SPPG_04399 [Spizellomyces punctatus DAOM BR117]|uniref:chitinase n=1 Tax=Spizellomyces punctatus (strain DAOM BR117) TaxID=645134 RepID=A0A0L0HGM8_SPIPD|nr:uncharacterized protein SPPG_04399 [Spizellomyces punctatus DAOM BR117]KND00055.1 hypothetical protein SPPG_04399 [Spizellomyces punctatus DAOM BR117]|eukprot:XP_016608094.1 hypothetical protein SPPG_04399 [Spizellomyces punctatus DAOM BR117]
MRQTRAVLNFALVVFLFFVAVALAAPAPLAGRTWDESTTENDDCNQNEEQDQSRWESKVYRETIQFQVANDQISSTWIGGVDFTLKIWYDGFCAHLHLINPASLPSATWRLAISLPPNSDLYTSWSGDYEELSDDGQQYIASPQDWNAEIVPGSSKTTGFCVQFPSPEDTMGMEPPRFLLKMYANEEDADNDSVETISPPPISLTTISGPTPSPSGSVTTTPILAPHTLVPISSQSSAVSNAPAVSSPSPTLVPSVVPSPSPNRAPSATPPSASPSLSPSTASQRPSSTPSPSATPSSTPVPISLPNTDPLIAKAQAGKLLVGYWGQNIAFSNPVVTGAAAPESEIDAYCSGPYDVLNIAFANVFKNAENTIDINLSRHCGTTFPGSTVLNCPEVGQAIRRCQALGKKVFLSLGGGIASVGFTDISDVNRFTTALWNMFLGGSDSAFVRPFGAGVILDGLDLDVEGGSDFGYDIFLQDIVRLMRASGRTFYMSGAPQCFFPDVLQNTAYAKGYFDWLNIQWYNNACGNNAYPNRPWRDAVEFWFNWANTVSVNPNVRLLIGAPASVASASPISFVPLQAAGASTPSLANIVGTWKSEFSSRFGGIMLWEVTTAEANGDYAQGVRALLGA